MKVAIIPARGGSRRIPRKNIRPFCGRPMIAWSIQAAQGCGLFDRVVVSTDCEEITKVAKDYGAWVPFRRPPELSDDHTPTMPVIRHAVQWLDHNHHQVTQVCCVYATAPFLEVSDLLAGYQALQSDPQLDFAFSVTTFDFPVWRGLRIQDNRVEMLWPEHQLTRSQDLETAYHDAGQFYWGRADAFRRHDGFFTAQSAPVVLPAHRVQDIDTPEDWTRAELMFLALKSMRAA